MRLARLPIRYLLLGLGAFSVAAVTAGVVFVGGGETAGPEEETASDTQDVPRTIDGTPAMPIGGVPAETWDATFARVLPLEPGREVGLSREAAEKIAASYYPNVSMLDVILGRLVRPLTGVDRPVWVFSLDPQDIRQGLPGETIVYELLFLDAETGDYVTVWNRTKCAPPGCVGPAPVPLSPPGSPAP